MANLANAAMHRRVQLWQRQRSWMQRCWRWLFRTSLLGQVAIWFTPQPRIDAACSARAFLDQRPLPTATLIDRATPTRRAWLPHLSLHLAAHGTIMSIVALVLVWSLALPQRYSAAHLPRAQQRAPQAVDDFDPQVVHQPFRSSPVVRVEDTFASARALPSARLQQAMPDDTPADVFDAPTVREDRTNLRAGPGRAYALVAQLHTGTGLRLLARHAQWVNVDGGTTGVGWVRADLLAVPQAAIDGLPIINDVEPPPPRWVWPTHGTFTSSFGWRSEPFRSFHNGIDIANRAGTPVVAAHAGTVTQAGWCRGFGYCVYLDHGAGIVTIYGHLLKKPPVAVGDVVDVGDLIGLMGSSYDPRGGGYSTGVHLHFTVKVHGKAVNPFTFLP